MCVNTAFDSKTETFSNSYFAETDKAKNMKHCNGVLFSYLDCTLKLPKVTCFGTEQKFANGTCYSNHVFKGIWNDAIFKNVTGRRRVSPTEEYWKYVSQNSKYQWKVKYLHWNIYWYISWQNVSNFIFYVHVKYIYKCTILDEAVWSPCHSKAKNMFLRFK